MINLVAPASALQQDRGHLSSRTASPPFGQCRINAYMGWRLYTVSGKKVPLYFLP